MAARPPLSLHYDDGKLVAGVGPKVGLAFIKEHFPHAKTVRIATAYFSLSGYMIGREYTADNIQFHVLVGREEGTNVQQAILEEISRELENCETNWYAAVTDLVDRMESGRFIIRDARSMQVPFHCKFYICDDAVLWHGSANYSKNGLLYNAEQNAASTSPGEIALFTEWYDAVAQEATDLLKHLLKILREWLDLSHPFDIYLRILLHLGTVPETNPGKGAHEPIYYQRAVIGRALRQIDDFGGALIVLATGLGKTIVGAELAHRLVRSGEIERVLLLAPNAVHGAWERQMEPRGLHRWFYPTDVLFRADSRKKHHQVHQIMRRLRAADSTTLILIDEAHSYKNQLLMRRKGSSRVYDRLLPAVRAGAKIILLTATAYGTNTKNFNSLLHLLPHRQRSGFGLLGPWEAADPGEFSRLPVVTILGLPDVLSLATKRRDLDDENRPYFLMQDERRYLPAGVRLVPIRYELPLQAKVGKAFNVGIFDHEFKIPHEYFDDEIGFVKTVTDAGYNAALNGWLSSPYAMRDLIQYNLETEDRSAQLSLTDGAISNGSVPNVPDAIATDTEQFELLPESMEMALQRGWGHGKGHAPLLVGHDLRRMMLEPLLEELADAPDRKLQELMTIVRTCAVEQKGKVLIFVRLYRTAVYLQTNVQERFPELRVGCTVEERSKKAVLKTRHARSEILTAFSPESREEIPETEYNVLICTDADGVGVNLQDADTVVNYDLPSAADVLFQRAGRVLRMTTRPERRVIVYTMIPSVVDGKEQGGVDERIRQRLVRLTRRHNQSRAITGATLLSNVEVIDFMQERNIAVEDWFREADLASSFGEGRNDHFASHMTILETYRERAEQLSGVLHGAKATPSLTDPHVVVLLEHNRVLHLIIFNLATRTLEKKNDQEILDVVRCGPEENPAVVPFPAVEAAAHQAVQCWCTEQHADLGQIKKICALYLQPVSDIPGIRQLMMHLRDSDPAVRTR